MVDEEIWVVAEGVVSVVVDPSTGCAIGELRCVAL